jgi:transposase
MFCGLDVAKNKSQVCILDDNKEIIKEFEISHTKEGFDELEKNITPETTIAMETTGVYSKAIYDYFKQRYKTIYVDNGQMHMFAKLHFSHMKNDKIDARLIAKYLSFGLKKINPIKEDELRDLSRLYHKVSGHLSRYKSMFKSQINIIFPEIETHFHLSQAKGITSLLIKHPSPEEIAKLSNEEIYLIIRSEYKTTGGMRDKKKFENKIKELAEKSVGIKGYPTNCLVETLKVLKYLEGKKEEIKTKIKCALLSSPYSKLLNEFGYSDASLVCIVGEVGDIRRFSNPKKFVSYCGLDISEKQSGTSKSRNCYITKRGSKGLRHTFYTSVLTQLNYRREGIYGQFYDKLVAKGKHPKQAMTAVARKLAVKCYFDMLKCHSESNTQYQKESNPIFQKVENVT